MILRAAGGILLLGFLAANTWDGIRKIGAFYHRDTGEKALARGELDLAHESFNRALRYQPDEGPTYILIARVLHLSQTNAVPLAGFKRATHGEILSRAMGALAAAISRNPADAWAWFTIGESYKAHQTRRKRFDRLKAAAEAALRKEAADGQEGDKDGPPAVPEPAAGGIEDRMVVAATIKAMELEPDYYFYFDYLAKLYWDRGLPDEAAEAMRTSFSMTPDLLVHPWVEELEFARALSGPILEGIEESARAEHIAPIQVAQARADFLEKVQMVPEAIDAFERLKEIGGDAVAVRSDVAIARLLQVDRRFEESIPYLRQAIRADAGGGPGSSAYYYLGLAHAAMDQHEEAVAAYRRYLTKKPGSLQVLLDLAGQLEALGRIPEAEQLYVAMVARFPEVELPYRKLIQHLQRQRRFDEAAVYRDKLDKLGQ